MEVRRGDDTCFDDGDRRMWASLDEWKATLPVGAEVVISGVREPEKPTGNPLLDRILAHGGQRRSTMYCVGSRSKILAANKKFYLSEIEKSKEKTGWHYERCVRRLQIVEKAIADTTDDNPIFHTIGKSRYFTQTEGGVFREVHYSRDDVVTGYFTEKSPLYVAEGIDLGESFVSLTDPTVPLWYFYARKMAPI